MRPAARNPLYKPWFANIMATFRSPSKCFYATIPTKIAAIISTPFCPLYSLIPVLYYCAILSTGRQYEANPSSAALPIDRSSSSFFRKYFHFVPSYLLYVYFLSSGTRTLPLLIYRKLIYRCLPFIMSLSRKTVDLIIQC